MCSSDLMGTGLQLHVGSIVTSSNSELIKGESRKCWNHFETMDSKLWVDLAEENEETYFWMALRIPHMYWSTSRPSNNAVLLKEEKKKTLNIIHLSHPY